MTTNDAKFAKLAVDQITVPVTDISVYQALYQRRMAWKFRDEAVPKAALERMLEAAVWAPNRSGKRWATKPMRYPWSEGVIQTGPRPPASPF